MRLAQLWRYPVKSLAGERLASARVDARGLEGDRLWALVDQDGAIASGKSTQRFRAVAALLRHRSRLDGGEPVPVERLRPNLLLEATDAAPFPEDDWLGRTLCLGTVELRIVERTERCVMVGHSQAGLDPCPRLLTEIGRANRACAGVYAEVSVPGTLHEGDTARLAGP